MVILPEVFSYDWALIFNYFIIFHIQDHIVYFIVEPFFKLLKRPFNRPVFVTGIPAVEFILENIIALDKLKGWLQKNFHAIIVKPNEPLLD